jgi:hypothetical protein
MEWRTSPLPRRRFAVLLRINQLGAQITRESNYVAFSRRPLLITEVPSPVPGNAHGRE